MNIIEQGYIHNSKKEAKFYLSLIWNYNILDKRNHKHFL